MKKLIFTLSLISCSLALIAQNCGTGGAIPSSNGSSVGSFVGGGLGGYNPAMGQINTLMKDVYSGRYLSSVEEYNQIKGSPFLTDESSAATLVMNDGTEIKDVPVKYDLYAKEIIATNKDGDEIVLDPKYYLEVIIDVDGQQLSFKKVNPRDSEKFYEVLYESEGVVFFKDQSARLRKGENLGITRSPSSFNQYSRYYVAGEDNSLAKVNLKKRDVFDHFPELEAVAFREHIKSSKIKLSKEKDYKQLFAAMD